jgi:hypothetical protein
MDTYWRQISILIMPGFFNAIISPPASVPFTTRTLYHRVDFGNTSCYPGTGTTVTDLVSSRAHTVFGGAAWNSGGYFTFDGVNDYIMTNANMSYTAEDFLGHFSTGAWVYPTTSAGVRDAYSIYESSIAQAGIVNDTNIRVRNPNGTLNTSIGWNLNQWQYIVHTYNYGTTSTGLQNRMYRNGSLIWTQGSSTARRYNNIVSERFLVGAFDNGSNGTTISNYFSGRIGDVHLYRDLLTNQEILNNYNATKGKYGL